MMVKTKLIGIFYIAFFAIMIVSCQSSRRTVRGTDALAREGNTYVPVQPQVDNDDIYITENAPNRRKTPQLNSNQRDLIAYAKSWEGVSYTIGGNSRGGVDCSGLICCVFNDITGIKLPRRSRDQATFCKKIDFDDLLPGDLMFFTARKGGKTISHVALYIGDLEMIHSTTSRGVIISSFDDDYWMPRLHHCGRVEALFR